MATLGVANDETTSLERLKIHGSASGDVVRCDEHQSFPLLEYLDLPLPEHDAEIDVDVEDSVVFTDELEKGLQVPFACGSASLVQAHCSQGGSGRLDANMAGAQNKAVAQTVLESSSAERTLQDG